MSTNGDAVAKWLPAILVLAGGLMAFSTVQAATKENRTRYADLAVDLQDTERRLSAQEAVDVNRLEQHLLRVEGKLDALLELRRSQ